MNDPCSHAHDIANLIALHDFPGMPDLTELEPNIREAYLNLAVEILSPNPNIEAAADGLLGYEIRAVLRHNWTEEGIDHIERAIAQRAVAAALTPGDTG